MPRTLARGWTLRPRAWQSATMRPLASLVALLLGALLVPVADHPPRAAAPAAADSGVVAIAGLAAPVELITDRWGIPHLRARTLPDLYRAWGYVTARDRLWQLESLRRSARGRMWEWAGNATLEADGGAQLFRLAERAETIWARERLDPATAMPLEAYAAGINAYLARCRAGAAAWPPEFTRLGHTPADWRPVDSVLLLLGMGITLDLDLPELREARDLARHGAAWLAARRRFEGRWIYDTVPDAGGRHTSGGGPGHAPAPVRDSPAPLPSALAERAARALAPYAHPDGDDAWRASNAFAVGARRSASGAPLLANDPHLSLTTPGAFHLVHVSVPGVVDAAGACLPGLPAIVSGRNRDCAWGITALSADVVDVYADTLSADGRRVRWHGGWAPVVERPFQLRYRVLGIGIPPPGQVRRWTPHGPVVVFDRARRLALSVRWTAFEDDRITLRRMLGVERSRDAAELAERFATLVTPTLNLVAADRAGHVRYQACGLLPHRPFPPAPGPLPGDGRHEWAGFVATADMPAWDVPADGVVVNSNNRPAGPAYPEPLPRYDWVHDRALRIAQRLGGDPSITLADLRSVQNDAYSGMAARLVPRLAACADSVRGRLSARAQAALDTLGSWDFVARRPQVAPTLYRAWFAALGRRWGLEGLPGRLIATLDGEAAPDPSMVRVVERPALGAAAALDSALADLEHLLGPDLAGWRWERAHRARFPRDLARWFPDEAAWRGASVAVDGDNASPGVAPSRLPRSIEVDHGPVFRHLVDLAVADSSLAMLPPAVAAGAAQGARALAGPWANHAYVPLFLDGPRVDAVARTRLRLVPGR